MKPNQIIALLIACLVFPVVSNADDWTPVQIEINENHQLFSKAKSVYGLKLSILEGSVTSDVYGLDVGLALNKSNNMTGIQVGGLFAGATRVFGAQISPMTFVFDDLYGIQSSIIYNLANAGKGAQLSLVANVAGKDFHGIQIAPLNLSIGTDGGNGLQIAFVNLKKDSYGLQMAGLLNKTNRFKGLQIGLVNYCESLNGMQIGLFNIIKEGRVKYAPILNIMF